MADLSLLLGQLPPGANVFDAVQDFLDQQVYPELGKGFYIQFYLLTGILGFSGLLFLLSLIINAKRGNLNLILYDGSCSRIDLKFIVPLLWAANVVLLVALVSQYKAALDNREFTRFMGAVWFLTYLPSSISYTLLSSSVAVSAPPVRRYLSRVSYGVIRYNLAVALVVCGLIVGMIIPALHHAEAMININKAHGTVTSAIDGARAQNDPSALMAVMELLPLLDKASVDYSKAHQTASAVYSGYCVVWLVTGSLPAFVLGRSVMKKIARLEAKKNSPTDLYNISSVMSDRIDLPSMNRNSESEDEGLATVARARQHIPEQPKDRPFAQLVDLKTTTFPHRFHVVLEAEDMSSQQRADSLKRILKTDFILVSIYFLILFLFLAGCLFMACGGLKYLDTRGDFIFGYVYFTWSFGMPALGLSIWLFWDATRPRRAEEPFSKNGATRHSASRFVAPSANAIQCSQVVSVSYVGGEETDSPTFQEKKMHPADLRNI